MFTYLLNYLLFTITMALCPIRHLVAVS